MLCVLILYVSGGTYSLKSAPNNRFFVKLNMAILFTFRVFARNLLAVDCITILDCPYYFEGEVDQFNINND